MWQILLAAAVAGSTGFATKHFLTPKNTDPLPAFPHCNHSNNNLQDPNENGSYESGSGSNSETQDADGVGVGVGVFKFSSPESLRQGRSRSRPKNPGKKSRGSKNGVRVPKKVEQRSDAEVRSELRNKGGRRLLFCLKKRRTTKSIAAKAAFCSSKDNSLFGWGLGFGVMYMMSAGKAEIIKLNKTMDETAKVVQELKSELNRRKPSCAHQILDSDGNIDMNYRKMGGKHDEVILKKTNSKLKGTDVRIWSPAVNDGGECGSSTLTEEPEPRVLEIDQLEAELEFELQKLSGCTIDSPCHEEIRSKLDELEVPDEGCNGTDDLNLNYSQSHGVLASELNEKLSHLLIKQQENQMLELESELRLAQSNLHQKEAELQALKECVRRLTELSLSTVSDDESQALTDPKGSSDLDDNNMDSESKQSVVGAKRPFDSESCSYCM